MAEETKEENIGEEKAVKKEEGKEQALPEKETKEGKKEEMEKEVKGEAKEKVKDEIKEEKGEGEKKEGPVEIPEKFKKLVGEIEKLNVLDLAALVKVLEKRFGVTAQAPVAVAPAGQTGAGEGSPQAEEKSIFNVELKEMGDKKIEVIKAVRDITGKGLKDSKDLVDALASGPQIVKEGVKKEEAEELKKKLEAAGAKVELK